MNMGIERATLLKRSGFTLVELMIVVGILAVIATLSLAVLRSSGEQAKESATLARIDKIETIVQMELEMYETRRLPISNSELMQYIVANPFPQPQAIRLLNLRRRILQDLINVEMPRPVIIGGVPNTSHLGVFPSVNTSADSPPGLAANFQNWLAINFPNPVNGLTLSQRLESLASADTQFWRMFNQDFNGGDIRLNLSAEYLYLLLSRIDYDGVPAIETFNKSSIGDTDGDGLLELLDAWGEPLSMAIYQVAAVEEPPPGSDIWVDNPVQDWSQTVLIPDLGFYPVGYTTLKSTIPRELGQIRIKVFSPRMELNQ